MHLSKSNSRWFYGSIAIALILVTVFVATLNIQPVIADGDWWNPMWQFRKEITIDHTKVDVGLTDFPVLIDTVDGDLASKAQSNGYDIVFTDDSGGKLSHEIELYDGGSGHLTAWVEVPTISSTVDTALYMYYGNPSAGTQQDVEGTWDSNYVMVQHLEETSGIHYDSTANDNDGTCSGGVTQATAGMIDGADSFDGTDDYISCGYSGFPTGSNARTLEAWIKTDKENVGSDWRVFFSYGTSTSYQSFFAGQCGTPGHLNEFYAGIFGADGLSGYVLSKDTWYHLVVTLTGTTMKFYVNGTLVGTDMLANTPSTQLSYATISSLPVVGYYWNGTIDEVRLSDTVRDDAWVKASYYSGDNALTSFGTEETAPKINHVILNSPSDGTTTSGLTVEFKFKPIFFQGAIEKASLHVNETSWSIDHWNQTVVLNNTENTIKYSFGGYGTYKWNIEVFNSTHSVWASHNRTITIRWLSGWLYRKAHNLTGSSGAGNHYQISFNVYSGNGTDNGDSVYLGGSCIAFPKDIRWTSDDCTVLDYWIEEYNGTWAKFWVEVKDNLDNDQTIYIYYGHNPPPSMSTGRYTWLAGSDFDLPTYFNFSARTTVLTPTQTWETQYGGGPHTLSPIEFNREGYKYWGYYGCFCDEGVGLAWSNDLISWAKYSGNPLLTDLRWPTVILVDDTIHLFAIAGMNHMQNSQPQYVVHYTSTDGYNFNYVEVVVPQETGVLYRNSFIWKDPNDGRYYLYYARAIPPGGSVGTLFAKTAETIGGLASASPISILTGDGTYTGPWAPAVVYHDGWYHLTGETAVGGWVETGWYSRYPTSDFELLVDNPVVPPDCPGCGDACGLPYIFNDTLYMYTCHTPPWDVSVYTAPLGSKNSIAGKNVSDWNLNDPSLGTFTYNETVHKDKRSGQFVQTSTSQHFIVYEDLATIDDDKRQLIFHFRAEHADPSHRVFITLSSGGHDDANKAVLLRFYDGNIEAHDGTGWNTLQSYTPGSFYRIRLYNFDFSSHQFDIDINNVNKGTNLGFYHDLPQIETFDLEGDWQYPETVYVDSLAEFKYVYPEPSHGGWGGEETEYVPAKLYINPPLVEKTSGDVCTNFDVNVTIDDVIDLFGFDFNLIWDNNLITLVDVDYNTTLDNIWGSGNWFVHESMNVTGPGYYKLAAVSISTGFATTEATPLATLTFHVEGPICNSMKETLIHFETHKLSDSTAQPIPHTVEDGTYRITGQTPTLQMSPTSVTCRKFCENFTITINASDICNAENFEFEIRYNTTLLDHVNVTWNAWGSGNITVAEANGNITGSTSGSPKTGNLTLMTITFHAAYYHIWKDLPGWTNNLTGTIYVQWANLSYPDAPDLRYEKGILYEINMDPIEVVYTFAPIQGDIDNDGDVDIMDLRTVAAYYDQEYDKYNLTGDSTIDIYDLVAVAANYNYKYDC